jgi:V-type H+-transporting ATPase subunit a
MFGDIGHGSLILIFTSILICFGERIVKNAPQMQQLHNARYILLLMGIFSTFCGLIYNDFLSIPLNLFGSCYNFKTGQRISPNCVYKAGIDPIWYVSQQEILFLNSVKMKIAVIIGVAHMILGLLQKGLNALYFKRRLDFVHEFVPQILMLFCMFGYMDILIIKKWLTNY